MNLLSIGEICVDVISNMLTVLLSTRFVNHLDPCRTTSIYGFITSAKPACNLYYYMLDGGNLVVAVVRAVKADYLYFPNCTFHY